MRQFSLKVLRKMEKEMMMVVINPPIKTGVAHFYPHTLATLKTCLSSLYRIYSPGFVIAKDNIGPLRMNSRCPAINSGTLSYSRYYIYSVSNLTLLFKTVHRKSQL